MIQARAFATHVDFLYLNNWYGILLQKLGGLLMNIDIDFFRENISATIGAGIYGVYIINSGNEELLYIGESVFVLVRWATHLFNFKKNPAYFGFNDNQFERNDIKLSFRLLKQVDNTTERKRLEKN